MTRLHGLLVHLGLCLATFGSVTLELGHGLGGSLGLDGRRRVDTTAHLTKALATVVVFVFDSCAHLDLLGRDEDGLAIDKST